MITKTLNLDSAYTELFDEIREKSNGAIDINNVEGFFGNIIEISALDKKYLRLPLDEPMFEIDANTRKIEVPNEFKSNGLSVQGDHLAETVYFVIDRYFDYMDLSNTDVTINWKMGAEAGKTDKFTMSADVIPGSIVFGWPVDNVVTQKSGTLTFAVEFTRKDNQGKILYDFNTLAANINIKDGLVIGDVEVVNLDNDILAALANSQFGEGEAAVGDVIWLTGNGNGLVRNLASGEEFIAAPFSAEINLDTNVVAGEPSSAIVDLYAQGYVDSSSEVAYTSMTGDTLTPIMLKMARELIPAEENSDEDKIYYSENGELVDEDYQGDLYVSKDLPEGVKYYVSAGSANPPAYNLASDEQIAAWGTIDEVELYVKLAKISVSEAGSYAIKAQGQKFDSEDRKIGAGATIASEIVTVPAVQAPSSIKVTATPLEDLDSKYSFDEEASANVVFLGEDGGQLTAEAIVDNFGALQFVWQKKVGEETSFSNGEENAPAYKLENEDILEVSEPGEYKVAVKNFMNGGYAPEVVSEVMIASPLAGKITSAVLQKKEGNAQAYSDASGDAEYDSTAGNIAGKVTLKISNVVIDGQEGDLAYKWYKRSGSGEDATYSLVSENEEYIITSGEGYFLPVVENIYNGSIYTYTLDVIFVNDRSND